MKIKNSMNALRAIVVLLLLACASCAFGVGAIYQRVQIGNVGNSDVTAASVLYGQQQLILGPARASYAAGNVGLGTYSIGLSSAIPEQTKIRWLTDGTTAHEALIATGSLVRNHDVFYGFRFYFADDHIDVYVIERVPNPANSLDLKYTKVFSSSVAQPRAQPEVREKPRTPVS